MKDWLKIYRDALKKENYKEDPAQLGVIAEFSRIDEQLHQKPLKKAAKKGFFSFIQGAKSEENSYVKGLYAYGDVGRGKTFLMDLFCEHGGHSVKRQHFHHFMKDIHDRLKQIKDQEDPLQIIAKAIAKDVRVLCLDEFFVSDITDAMLLDGLLRGFIREGVTIITTSNIHPDDLYKNGLQRERFLQAIALINENFVVYHIEDGVDYRMLCLDRFDKFILSSESSNAKLLEMATELSKNLHLQKAGLIEVNSRKINYVAKSAGMIWFEFSELCEGNRSQLDYIWLADHFHVIILSDIPVLDTYKEDAARRFLLLIDELYDRRIGLILSSEVIIDDIYQGKKLNFEFKRLQSRLFEMQSKAYGEAH